MKTTPPEPNDQDREARLTALLLGELSPENAAELRAELAENPELKHRHNELQRTIALLRDAMPKTSAKGIAESPRAEAKLSQDRRMALFRQFRTVAEVKLPAQQPGGRREILWFVPLALAAGVMLLFGLFGMRSTEGTQRYRLAKNEAAGAAVEDGRMYLRGAGSERNVARAILPPPVPIQPPEADEPTILAMVAEPSTAFQSTENLTGLATGLGVAVQGKSGGLGREKLNSGTFKGGGIGAGTISPTDRLTVELESRVDAPLPAVEPVLAEVTLGSASAAPMRVAPRPAAPPFDSGHLKLSREQPGRSRGFQSVGKPEALSGDKKSDRDAGTLSAGDVTQSAVGQVAQNGNFHFGKLPTDQAGTAGGRAAAAIKPRPGAAPAAREGSALLGEAVLEQAAADRGGPLAENAAREAKDLSAGVSLKNGIATAAEIDRTANEPLARGSILDPKLAFRYGLRTATKPAESATAPAKESIPALAALDSNGRGSADGAPAAGRRLEIKAKSAMKRELSETDANLPRSASQSAAPVPQPEVQSQENNFSTFSLNVSDVSFKLAAASLEKGIRPDPASIRSEEFINALQYRDPEAAPGAPLAFAWERAQYPFAQQRDVLRLSVRTGATGREASRPLNLVLLLDNSGSMERADRVAILREALRTLAAQLQPADRISVVTFARTARLWIDALPGAQAGTLADRLGELNPEGGTNLEDALKLAYATAQRHFLAQGGNRVVLLTDGAANLGEVNPASLQRQVESGRQRGVALDCFGIGWEGLNDDLLEELSRHGDGRYGFVNTPEEAAQNFAAQLAGALHVAASDVKVQVEFNPQRVTAWRQVGYARHQLTQAQFRDNTVDAAELAAAEAGNAIYVLELRPAGFGPVATVRARYKEPHTANYHEHSWLVPYSGASTSLDRAPASLRLATTAAAFAEWLAASPYAGEVTPDRLLKLLPGVSAAFEPDPRPRTLESMLRQAQALPGK